MSLRIYNTLTRQKEPFVPLVPGQVGLYVCGITPYDVSHIGHARSALVFDVVARYLRFTRLPGDLRQELHRRGRQDHRPREPAEGADRGAHRAVHRGLRSGHGQARGHAADDRATGDRAHPRDGGADRAARGGGRGLRRGRRRVLRGAAIPRLRTPVGQESRRAPRGRAGRRERAEAGPPGLRALEGGEARRAVVAEPVGPRPAGLAHRVLRHGDEVPRRDARSARRRRGPDLPASLVRDRPVRGRHREAVRPDAGSTTAS